MKRRGIMAADKIQVDIDKINGLSKKFKDASNTAKNTKGSMQRITDTLVNGWNGKSVREFESTYKILYNNMNTYTDILDTISKNLSEVAKAFYDSDEAVAKSFSGKGKNI
jgi:WXG100 family type VII secretion target